MMRDWSSATSGTPVSALPHISFRFAFFRLVSHFFSKHDVIDRYNWAVSHLPQSRALNAVNEFKSICCLCAFCGLWPEIHNKIKFYLNSVNREIRNGIIWWQTHAFYISRRARRARRILQRPTFYHHYLHLLLNFIFCVVRFCVCFAFGSSICSSMCSHLLFYFHLVDALASAQFIQSKVKITINSASSNENECQKRRIARIRPFVVRHWLGARLAECISGTNEWTTHVMKQRRLPVKCWENFHLGDTL